MPICRECGITFPNRIKINGITRILHKRKFCLKCSPFGAHNTKSYGYNKHRTPKLCIVCGKETPSPKNMFCVPNGACDAIYTFTCKINIGEIPRRDTVRRYLLLTREHICTNCKLTTWLGNEIPLESHHKDGNYKNNKEENLELLCPTCHSITDNYKWRNRGNGRNEYKHPRR